MLTPLKVFVALSMLWSVVALAVQAVAAWGGGRQEYSKRAGSPLKGMLYIFTVAMTPTHKETIRYHPVEFAIGLVMHIGVFLATLGAFLLLAWPTAGLGILALGRPLTALALLAGSWLFVRRVFSRTLRAMSAPDDYLAILATCGLLALACVRPIDAQNQFAFLIYAGLLFIYLPLGKLRHAVFFFLARGDYGRRLGYRGVYPPSAASRVPAHGGQ